MINTIELRCLKKSMAWARTLSVFISSGKIPSNDLNDPYETMKFLFFIWIRLLYLSDRVQIAGLCAALSFLRLKMK